MLNKLHIFIIWFFSWIKRHPIKIILLFVVVFSIFPPYKYHSRQIGEFHFAKYFKELQSIGGYLEQDLENKISLSLKKRFNIGSYGYEYLNNLLEENGFVVTLSGHCLDNPSFHLCYKRPIKTSYYKIYKAPTYDFLLLGNFLRSPFQDSFFILIILNDMNLIEDIKVSFYKWKLK